MRVSIKKNFGYNLIYTILNIIIPLITAPYTSRVLGAANIGIYSYTYSIISTVIMFGVLGTATYGQKEIASLKNDDKVRTCVFWEIFVLRVGMSLVVILLFVPYLMNSSYFVYFLLQTPFLLSAMLDVSWYFQGVERFKNIAVRNIFVRIIGVVLLLLLVKTQDHLWIYLLIIGMSQLLGNLSMWPYLKLEVGAFHIRKSHMKYHFKETLVYFIPSVAHQIYAVLDKTMLGILVGSDYENGYYEQAQKIINMVVSIFTAYTVVMRSRMSVLFAEHKKQEIGKMMNKSSNFIAMMVFPMMFGLAATAKGIVPWFFGAGYDHVVILLIVLCPVFFFMGYSHMIGSHLLTPSGRQGKSNIAQCIAAGINVVLNAVLIPRFFAVGAAIASVISEMVIFVLYFWFVRDEYTVQQAWQSGWKKLVSAVVMLVILLPICDQMSYSILSSLIEVCIGTIVYGVVLLLLRDEFTCDNVVRIIENVKNKWNNESL